MIYIFRPRKRPICHYNTEVFLSTSQSTMKLVVLLMLVTMATVSQAWDTTIKSIQCEYYFIGSELLRESFCIA